MHSPSGFKGPLHGGSRSGSPSSQPGAPSPPGSRPDSPIQPPPPTPADPGSESDNEDDLGPGDHRPDAEEQLPFSRIEDVKLSQEFIELLKSANLDDSGLGPDDLEDLRKPSAIPLEVLQNPDFRLSIRLFLSSLKSSEATYTENVAAIKERFPECTGILSLDQVKRRLKQLTGVVPVMHDMCVNTCIAFTGPFSELDTCNHCSQPRYDSKGAPRRRFSTLPIGPQLQAQWASPKGAQNMRYQYWLAGDFDAWLKKAKQRLVPDDHLDLRLDLYPMAEYPLDSRFLEDNDGIPLDSKERNQVYGAARSIWRAFAQSGSFPPPYQDVNHDYLKQFQDQLESQFSFLRLCVNHYKVEYIWKRIHNSFQRNFKTKIGGATVKDEPPNETEAGKTADIKGKRPLQQATPAPPSKRPCVGTSEAGSSKSHAGRVSLELVGGDSDDASSLIPSPPSRVSVPKIVNPLSSILVSVAIPPRVEAVQPAATDGESPKNSQRAESPPTNSNLSVATSTSGTNAAAAPTPDHISGSSHAANEASISSSHDDTGLSAKPEKFRVVPPNPCPRQIKTKKVSKASEKALEQPACSTALALCQRDWLASNPGGTKGAFEVYRGGLTQAGFKVFQDEAARLKRAAKGKERAAS
ncbi:hypothetical protein HGRIS_005665 [Hohenbuehelia grisea]|uniref:Transposase n=1 Tax=Hohenbuehelia grisea TaxID=104357 RepID=A0ABR3JYL9_9AGAR